jgi:hypothetical protein
VVGHQIGDDFEAAFVGGGDKCLEVIQGAVGGMHFVVVGDVVAVVFER